MITPLEQARQRIEAAARPSWKLAPASAPTRSKLGGLPDGPIGGDWPLWKGRPQDFLAQIDLAELHAAHGPDWLPDSGRLLFFFDTEDMVNAANVGGYAVRYLPPAAMDTAAIPEGVTPFPAQYVTFVPARSWPAPDRIEGIRELVPDRKELGELYAPYSDFHGFTHRIGGYPGTIQYDIDITEETGLLLQLDSDDALDWMWGDAGRLYFRVSKTEARAGNFDNCWMDFQCC